MLVYFKCNIQYLAVNLIQLIGEFFFKFLGPAKQFVVVKIR